MRKKISWTGNKRSRELHRSVKGEPHNPQCNYDEIAKEYLRSFKTATEAIRAGFDVSAHCTTKHFKSKRNATHHRNELDDLMKGETREE